MKRSWQRAPRRGEKQRYRDRIEWRWYERFLPPEMRLTTPPREEWWQWRNETVHLDRLEAEHPRVTVVLLHGGGGNGRILMTLAPMLVQMGARVVAPDLPGYGLTVRRRRQIPTYDTWADLAADLAEKEKQETGLPVVTCGLSLGGFLAYIAATRTDAVDGVIATTLLDTRERKGFAAVASSRIVGAAGAVLMPLLPRLVHGIRFPIRWVAPMQLITNDPDFSAVFSRDPLAGGSPAAFGFLRSLRLVRVHQEPEQFTRARVLVAHPALDPWTPPELSRGFFERLACEKQWVDLEGCGHLPYENPGRERFARAVRDFLDGF